MRRTVVLDASAFLAFSDKTHPGAELVRAILRDSIMSAVSAAEVVTVLVRRGLSRERAERAMTLFLGGIVAFDAHSVTLTAEVKLRHPQFTYPECAALALAKSRDLALLTCDSRMAGLGVAKVELLPLRRP